MARIYSQNIDVIRCLLVYCSSKSAGTENQCFAGKIQPYWKKILILKDSIVKSRTHEGSYVCACWSGVELALGVAEVADVQVFKAQILERELIRCGCKKVHLIKQSHSPNLPSAIEVR